MHDTAHNVSRVKLMKILKTWDRWTEKNEFDLKWKKKNGVLPVHDRDNTVERENDGGERIVLRGESGCKDFDGWVGLDKDLEDTEAENDGETHAGGDLDSPGETEEARRAKRARVSTLPQELRKELEREFVVPDEEGEEETTFGFQY